MKSGCFDKKIEKIVDFGASMSYNNYRRHKRYAKLAR